MTIAAAIEANLPGIAVKYNAAFSEMKALRSRQQDSEETIDLTMVAAQVAIMRAGCSGAGDIVFDPGHRQPRGIFGQGGDWARIEPCRLSGERPATAGDFVCTPWTKPEPSIRIVPV